MANSVAVPASYKEELGRLETLLGERDTLGKLFDEVQVKEIQTVATIQECKNAITSINSMRIKLKASLNMSQALLKTMQNMELQRKNLNMFVYGPNPIFSSARDTEINFSINNQFVLDMLQELDISYHVAQNNMRVARECKKNYKQNKTQILESLQSLQVSIDAQSQLIASFQSNLATQKSLTNDINKNLVPSMEAIINDKVTKIHENEI